MITYSINIDSTDISLEITRWTRNAYIYSEYIRFGSILKPWYQLGTIVGRDK